MIKNLILIICMLVLTFQFNNSFKELKELVETNEPYKVIPGEQISYNLPDIRMEEFENLNIQRTEEINKLNYVKVETLSIYTYKLFQTILLLFGLFLCLVFLVMEQGSYSFIETISELKEEKSNE